MVLGESVKIHVFCSAWEFMAYWCGYCCGGKPDRLLEASGQGMVTVGLRWENGVCMVYILDEYERAGLAVGSIHS